MHNTKKILTQLLSLEPLTDAQQQRISIYIPLEEFRAQEMQTQVNSSVTEAVKEHPSCTDASVSREELRDAVQAELEKRNTLAKGFAIFLECTDEPSVTVVALSHTPQKEVFVGAIYSLAQLAQEAQSAHTDIVLDIHDKESTLYKLTDEGLEKLRHLESIYQVPEADEYRDKRTPTGNKEKHFGTGSEKHVRKHETEQKLFLNRLREELQEVSELSEAKHFLVFIPSNFSEQTDSFVEELQREQQHLQIHTIAEQPPTATELQTAAQNYSAALHREQTEKQLDTAQEKYDTFASGWDKVAEADQHKNIATLFLEPTAEYSGYILDDSLVYTEQVPDSIPVSNISPWLVKNTLVAGGEVQLTTQEDSALTTEVAAELRFTYEN